ncbi:OmpH family outer membrane protein [Paracoccus beibuensis]|uniref:OmpH family outer membrane protein n=1 Tax=Paracoccus beibuensis TaxID=547602 RepID=UPI00224030BC|nr:OmpH family outer membrane protein [Paracoccus beibuensis]
MRRKGLVLPVMMVAAALALPAAAQDAVPIGPAAPQVDQPRPEVDLPNSIIAAPDEAGPLPIAPVLTLDQDALYLSSSWGLRAQARLEAEGEVIAAENERLTELLSTEEAALTAQRATLPAAEFRRLAEDFDRRATQIRRERAQAVQALNAWADADREAFFRAALPVMGEVMQERGAIAVLDRRTVFVSLDAIDITGELITALNASIGDGDGAVPVPQDQPASPSGQTGDPVADQAE